MTEMLSRWPHRGPLYADGPKRRSVRDMDRIAYDVARRHGFLGSLEDLKRRDKTRRGSRLRMDVMHALYAAGRFSYPMVGEYMRRDHSTVIHADRRVVQLCALEAV